MNDQLLSVSAAVENLLSNISTVSPEEIQIHLSAGRILSSDIQSNLDLPLFTNSSMDGFAVRAEDVLQADANKPAVLTIIEDIPAGRVSTKCIGKNQTARIMTGAAIPEGCDAVVPIENTDLYSPGSQTDGELPSEVRIQKAVKQGDYLRRKGEDIHAGQTVINAHTRLRAQDIGLLAMLGIGTVSVFRKPRVVILSTGDELVPVGRPLQPGKIHDSNAYTLSALIARDGGEAEYLGIVRDSEQEVRATLHDALRQEADLIISSAGVSVGAFDFVRKVVQSEGKLDFWRVNMRPGKPITSGNYHEIPFIGLPGNPVSAFVGYEVFVHPAVLKLTGFKNLRRNRIKASILERIESDGRESYLRAIAEVQDGKYVARLTGHQGSGNLLSLVQANALLIIPSGVKSLPSGSEVEAWLLNPG